MTQIRGQLDASGMPAAQKEDQMMKAMPMLREEFVRQFKAEEVKLLKMKGLSPEELEGLVTLFEDAAIYRQAEKIRDVYRKLGGEFSNEQFGSAAKEDDEVEIEEIDE